MFLHLDNFGLGLGSVADFSNTGARTLTSVECDSCLPAWRDIQFKLESWRSFLSCFFYLINRHHPYRWVTVVTWLNYLILTVDLWGSSIKHLLKNCWPKLWIHLPYFTSTMLLPLVSIHKHILYIYFIKKKNNKPVAL